MVGLVEHLGISQATFFGESYGGAIATMIAVHHPQLVDRVATYGATLGPSEAALNPEMLRLSHPLTPDAMAFQFQKEHYKRVAPDQNHWSRLWNKALDMRWGRVFK